MRGFESVTSILQSESLRSRETSNGVLACRIAFVASSFARKPTIPSSTCHSLRVASTKRRTSPAEVTSGSNLLDVCTATSWTVCLSGDGFDMTSVPKATLCYAIIDR